MIYITTLNFFRFLLLVLLLFGIYVLTIYIVGVFAVRFRSILK